MHLSIFQGDREREARFSRLTRHEHDGARVVTEGREATRLLHGSGQKHAPLAPRSSPCHVVERRDATVGEDRNRQGLLDPPDGIPVTSGRHPPLLLLSPPVDRDDPDFTEAPTLVLAQEWPLAGST